jgi:hypothetical protein
MPFDVDCAELNGCLQVFMGNPQSRHQTVAVSLLYKRISVQGASCKKKSEQINPGANCNAQKNQQMWYESNDAHCRE